MDEVIKLMEKLLAYDFGGESDYCIDLAVASGNLLRHAKKTKEALDRLSPNLEGEKENPNGRT